MISEEIDIIVPEDILKDWQEIVNILAQYCEVPAALIMRLRDPDIEVFISSESGGNPYHPGDSEHFDESGLYCETVIKSKDRLLVPNALADELWKNNPDIKLNMISYLGFPVYLPSGKPFGTICVLDNKRNEYSKVMEQLMLKFKGMIESHLEMIYMNQILGDKNKRLADYLMEIQAFRGIVPICSSCKSIRDQQGEWHSIEQYLIKHPEADFSHGICPECMKKLYPDFDEGS
jgi:GAF domain-containing protein